MLFRLIALTSLSVVAELASCGARAQDDFYKGKQIRLIVSTDAGGAYDTYARLLSAVMKEHIPGNPTIIVQNMPGAGGLKVANYIAASAPRDGTVIAATHASILTAQLTSPAAANFEATRLSWIGSITTDPYVGYVWHTAPVKTLADTRSTEVVMGGVSVGTAGTDYGILARDLFGLKITTVNGYKSSNDVKLAMERGEVQGAFANGWSSIRNADLEWIRDGKIRIIVQHGFRPLPDLPDVPLFISLAQTDADRQALVFMLARQEAAKPYFAPPEIPAERLAILRRAFDASVHDPRFLSLAAEANVTVEGPMTGDELAGLVAKVSQTPPEVIARINRMLAEKNNRMPDGLPLTDILASVVADTPSEAITTAVEEPAKILILDTIGVALAASTRTIGKIVVRHVVENAAAAATATVLGAAIKTSAPMAAFANGTLANALDFDEGSHLSTHILAAALAVAEDRGLSGKAMLDAFILAYEAGARLTQAIDFRRRQRGGPTHRGWWHVGLIGPIAAAMAACRLLGFDTQQTATAIGIASCSAGGFRRNMGTMAKALHSGNAARAGLEAAMFARHGLTADTAIIEAPLGFLQAVALPEELDVAAITERLGRPYVLEGTLRIKRYPACNPGHPLIDAALRLVNERGIVADEIERVEADLHTFSLLRGDPVDEESAGFSGAFLIAAALIYGCFSLEQLDVEVVRDPRVRALINRIHHVPAGQPETMVACLRDGRREKIDVQPVRRLSERSGVLEKFDRCAVPVVGGRKAAEILKQQIGMLRDLPDLNGLMAAAARAAVNAAA